MTAVAAEAGRHRAGRHLHHDVPAAGRARRALPRARRAALRRRDRVDRRQRVRDGRLGPRRRDRRAAEVPRRAVGQRAGHASRRRAVDVVDARKQVEAGIREPGDEHDSGADGTSHPSAPTTSTSAMILDYWGPRRLNHHTEATSMLYAARECARLLVLEGARRRRRAPPAPRRRDARRGAGARARAVRRPRPPDAQRGRRRDPRRRRRRRRARRAARGTSASRSARRSVRCTAASGASAPWATTPARTPC